MATRSIVTLQFFDLSATASGRGTTTGVEDLCPPPSERGSRQVPLIARVDPQVRAPSRLTTIVKAKADEPQAARPEVAALDHARTPRELQVISGLAVVASQLLVHAFDREAEQSLELASLMPSGLSSSVWQLP